MKKLFQIIRAQRKTKFLFFIVLDILCILFSVWAAFLLKFDNDIPKQYFSAIQTLSILSVLFLIPIFYFQKLYSFSWSYVSTQELVALFRSLLIGFVFISSAIFISRDFFEFVGFPRSTLLTSYILIFFLCGTARFSKRIYLNIFKKEQIGKARTLIIGAGDAGEQILRNIKDSSPYLPIGFIDDNASKQGSFIHGVMVLSGISNIPTIVKEHKIDTVIVALPSASSTVIKRAVEMSRKAGIQKIKIIPPLSEVISGSISYSSIKDFKLEDLLGRDSFHLNLDFIFPFFNNKRILITGAAGSIGSELSRQLAAVSPSALLILDQDETGIFNIEEELKIGYPNLEILSTVADITNRNKIKKIFNDFKPQIVFHAAAYKHVPLMERFPEEAIKNNIFGTKIIAESAIESGAEKFVFISTDKAVNPTSIMGVSKRVGEMVCQNANQKNVTKFISVRFGNVLGSRGSAILTFKDQIKRGGPLEITHPEMKRYFMIIPEAINLVLQAASMGNGGEIFVLDMGNPIRIVDLARDLVRLSGLEPDKDIAIIFTKPRPGEKLFEELLTAEEGTVATKNENIFVANSSPVDPNKLMSCLSNLEMVADNNASYQSITNYLKEIVPSYKQ